MAVTITGTIKYARLMEGQNANGEKWSFFSFTVLDTDEGVRWPLQIQPGSPDFDNLVKNEKTLMDQPVTVVLRSFSTGYRKVKQDDGSTKNEPTSRFYAKSVKRAKEAVTN
jgi:hypothetical protein